MTQKMREYVDKLAGEGAWDDMHDLFEDGSFSGLSTIPVMVDGAVVNIIPGTDREITIEQVKAEVRKAIAQVESGEATVVVFGDSYRGEPDADTGC